MAQPTKEGLVRGIRRWELVAMAVNGIIGAGIFGLPSEVFGRIGPYSLFAFLRVHACRRADHSMFRGSGQPFQ